MRALTQATVVFLKNSEGNICLAQKKKPIHHENGEITYSLGTWNGYGGKKEAGDKTIEDTAIRELVQESGVTGEKKDLQLCGHVYFFWPNTNGEVADMEVYFYVLPLWQGEVKEGDEMGKPQFFAPQEIPYDEMMGGDRIIIPKMLQGGMVEGTLHLGKLDENGRPLFTEMKVQEISENLKMK